MSELDYIDIAGEMERYGILISVSALKDILSEHQELVKEIAEYGLDTWCRECTVDAIAQKFTGRPFPMNGENWSPARFDEFVRTINNSIAQHYDE